jgi:nucleoside-triphosphatase THEP1
MRYELTLDESPAVAAIFNDGSSNIDAMLATFAEQQRRAGRRVLGLVMTHRNRGEGCQAAMVLTDIDTGDEYLVSQDLGAESTSCRADPQGFAKASRVLRDALEQQPDLVVCNRFGALEAAKGGFVDELLALLERGIPVLTVVAPRYFDAWQRFIGEAPLLPIDPEAWVAWLDAVLLQRTGSAEEPLVGADQAVRPHDLTGFDSIRPLSWYPL